VKIAEYIDGVIEREGGYTDHPNDKGGKTNFGITESVARAYGYQGDMRDLPEATARDIYLKRYWLDPKLDAVFAVSPLIAEEMLDTGVNMGPGVAGKFLQRALNHLNRQAKDYPDVVVDGRVGAITVQALKDLLRKRGKDGESVVFRMLNAQQSVRYMEITEANVSQEEFAFGWQSQRVQ
jgi:lysozyme family protein